MAIPADAWSLQEWTPRMVAYGAASAMVMVALHVLAGRGSHSVSIAWTPSA